MSANSDVLILAGDRGPDDPVARFRGVPGKVLAAVGGRPMLARVLEAVDGCEGLGEIHLLGPAREHQSLVAPVIEPWKARIVWHPPEAGPSASVVKGLRRLPAHRAALLTTGDHALLRAEILRDFLAGAAASGADVCVALVPWPQVAARFPGSRRTRYRFRDGQLCGANLFWFSGPAAGKAADIWRRVERERKKPWRVARLLGPWNLFRFLTRRMRMEEAFEALSKRLGLTVRPVVLMHAEAAVDVDSLEDLALVEGVLAQRDGR